MSLMQLLSKLKAGIQAQDGDNTALLALLNPALDAAAPYEGLDADAAREAIAAMPDFEETKKALTKAATERDGFQAQLTEQTDANTSLQRQLVATRGLSQAGVLPEYEELMQPAVVAMLVDGEDGRPTLPADFAATLRQKYPAMLAAANDAAGSGTGGGDVGTGGGKAEPNVINRRSGVITGVDPAAILDGSAVLAPL